MRRSATARTTKRAGDLAFSNHERLSRLLRRRSCRQRQYKRCLNCRCHRPSLRRRHHNAAPGFEDVPVIELLGWSELDEEGSDRARFRCHIRHIVERYHGFDGEHMAESLLLARNLASAIACERIRDMLLQRLRQREEGGCSRNVLEAASLILELVTAVTDRDCNYRVMERVNQLEEYPVEPPTAGDSSDEVTKYDELKDEDVFNIQYL